MKTKAIQFCRRCDHALQEHWGMVGGGYRCMFGREADRNVGDLRAKPDAPCSCFYSSTSTDAEWERLQKVMP